MSDSTRLGVIGAGNWGKNLLRAFSSLPGAELIVVSDTDEAARARAEQQVPGVRTVSEASAVLADPSIDAVAIATPAVTHANLVIQALEAGKHVFVEKPMCLSSDEATRVQRVAASHSQVLMVGHLLEYHPAVDKLKELVDSGELGALLYLYSARVNLGVVRRDENAWWSLAPHDISVALYLLGREPVSVTARGAAYLNREVEDVVFATMKFEDGVMAHIHVSWLDPHKIRKFTIVGDKKMATFDDMEPAEKVRIYDKGVHGGRTDYASYPELVALRQGDVLIPMIKNTEPLKAELSHFVEAVREGRTPRSDLADGLGVVRVLEAGQRSLELDGQPVAINDH